MWSRPARGRFTSDFGPRVAPAVGASTFHRGVDIAPPKPGQAGVDVVAAGAGEVIAVGTSTVRGIWVVVRHTDGTVTRYQHLAARTIQLKQKVTVGTVLGEMGATGLAVGIHLHYETFTSGADWTSSVNATDPEPFMTTRGVDLRVDTPPTTPEDDMPTLQEIDAVVRVAVADEVAKVMRGGEFDLEVTTLPQAIAAAVLGAQITRGGLGPAALADWIADGRILAGQAAERALTPAVIDHTALAASLAPLLERNPQALTVDELGRIATFVTDLLAQRL